MSLKQIVVKNATTMSLHERFTKIQKNKESSSGERVMQQLASSRNRRLAQHMERRPSVMAALKKDSIKSRLGLPGAVSVRDRLRYPRAFTARRGRGGLTGKSPLIRGLNRSNAMDVDMGPSPRRARSPFIANKIAAQRRSRSRSRSRPPPRSRSRSRSRNRSASISRFRNRSRSRSRSRFGSTLSLRGQYSNRVSNFRRGRLSGRSSRNDLRSYRPKLTGFNTRGYRRRGGSFRGRGRGRGVPRGQRGRGRGRNNYQEDPVALRNQLDRELDDFMSTNKGKLDKDLDVMMTPGVKWD